ncbi:MAG: HesA/MoeB/ThiF family protein [Planctomycetes bacterium]|nr:HesA/MoeB/ThiF family protein [Planctomycetota bacterium]
MQRRLRDARVLVVGAGGLGCPAAIHLAAAGVGTLVLADFDVVDLSNLQRQVLHATRDVGRPKVESARARLRALAPGVRVEALARRLEARDAAELVRRFQVVVDGSDNFETKYALNAASVATGVPWIFGGILRFVGQVMTIRPGLGACYRCLFREPPPPGCVASCQEAGVLGAIAGVIGSLQAAEALKLLLASGAPLTDRLLLYDGLESRFRTVRLRRDPECPDCGGAKKLDTPAAADIIP